MNQVKDPYKYKRLYIQQAYEKGPYELRYVRTGVKHPNAFNCWKNAKDAKKWAQAHGYIIVEEGA